MPSEAVKKARTFSSSIVVKSPLRHSSPTSCYRAVHRRSAVLSITVHLPLRCPSPSIAVVLSVHRRHARAVPCRQGAVARRPSSSRSRHAVPHRQGAVVPSIAIEEQSRRTSPSRSRRPCRLTTPATRLAPLSLLSSGWLLCCLSSCRRLTSAGASHCGHRLSCLSSFRIVAPSPRFSCCHLPSASASSMVQLYVGEKLLKHYILRVFTMSDL